MLQTPLLRERAPGRQEEEGEERRRPRSVPHALLVTSEHPKRDSLFDSQPRQAPVLRFEALEPIVMLLAVPKEACRSIQRTEDGSSELQRQSPGTPCWNSVMRQGHRPPQAGRLGRSRCPATNEDRRHRHRQVTASRSSSFIGAQLCRWQEPGARELVPAVSGIGNLNPFRCIFEAEQGVRRIVPEPRHQPNDRACEAVRGGQSRRALLLNWRFRCWRGPHGQT